ncbi:FAD binding domain-containing protein, partial [Colletotrichum asianum]
CTELSSAFGPALFYPQNDTTQFWDQKQQLAGQICRVEPSTPDDVAKALAIVITNACPFAIKGGGHSREVNDSNAPGGVTIDTVRMRKVVPDEDDKTVVTLGAGHNLGSALAALSSLNLSFPVGRVSSIGRGGFLLGGGQGDLGGKLGFAMDNVLELLIINKNQIVLANGTITTACPTTNPDLYWALRGGGGNNFGIVTAFTLRAVPETPICAAPKFGAPCPRHESVEAGIDSWIATSAMIGVRVEADGEWRVYAPRGLSDFFNMVVRPNPQIGVREKYEEKARRWLGIWTGLTVMPWVEREEPLKLVS